MIAGFPGLFGKGVDDLGVGGQVGAAYSERYYVGAFGVHFCNLTQFAGKVILLNFRYSVGRNYFDVRFHFYIRYILQVCGGR